MHMLIRWLRRDCDWVSLLYEHLHERTNQTLHGTVAASFVTKLTCMGGVVRDKRTDVFLAFVLRQKSVCVLKPGIDKLR